jgi:Domain of unknown function (DUF4397)
MWGPVTATTRPTLSRPRALRARPRPAGVVAALVAVAAWVLAFAAPAGADTGTYVRLAQLAPEGGGVAMTVTSASDPSKTVMLPAAMYGGVSDYQRIEPGDYVVAIRPSGDNGPPAVTAALKAVAGASYTLAAVGRTSTTGLSILTDDLTPPTNGGARLRVVAAAPDAATLDVRGPGGVPVALGLATGQAGPYRSVPAGTLTLTAGAPGSSPTPLSVGVGANQVITVVVVSHDGTLAAQPHVDAAGPVAVPPGPVDAGYGGAADAHGLLPDVVLGVLALVATLVAVVQARRGRARPRGTC